MDDSDFEKRMAAEEILHVAAYEMTDDYERTFDQIVTDLMFDLGNLRD